MRRSAGLRCTFRGLVTACKGKADHGGAGTLHGPPAVDYRGAVRYQLGLSLWAVHTKLSYQKCMSDTTVKKAAPQRTVPMVP